jgi:DNA-binding NtrC family response regulator
MTRRFMDHDAGLRLAETQIRITEAATWLGRDVAELGRLLDRWRACRRILLVGPAEALRGLAGMLANTHDVLLVATPETAYELVSLNAFDAVITEHDLRGPHDGLWLLRQMRASHAGVRRVLIAADELEGWAQHERDGLLHRFLVKPVHAVDLADLFGEETNP